MSKEHDLKGLDISGPILYFPFMSFLFSLLRLDNLVLSPCLRLKVHLLQESLVALIYNRLEGQNQIERFAQM